MAILYVFTVNDPGDVGAFPPSVTDSDWFRSIESFWDNNSISNWRLSEKTVIIFDNQAALDTYIADYKLTDSTLVADVNAWKSAHGISYSTAYYTLADANITPTPSPIV